MSQSPDGLDRLRATNPIDGKAVEGPDSWRAQNLLQRIIQTSGTSAPARRRLRQAAVAAVILGATTAAAVVWVQTISNPTGVSCYQASSLDAHIAAAPSGGPATAGACGPVWSDQVLVNEDIASPGSIPPLTACVAENGSLAVFPTDNLSICSQLGLATPDLTDQDQLDRIRDVEAQLVEFFVSGECIPMESAEEAVTKILAENGLGWETTTQPTTTGRPCASFAFDSETMVVALVPIPND